MINCWYPRVWLVPRGQWGRPYRILLHHRHFRAVRGAMVRLQILKFSWFFQCFTLLFYFFKDLSIAASWQMVSSPPRLGAYRIDYTKRREFYLHYLMMLENESLNQQLSAAGVESVGGFFFLDRSIFWFSGLLFAIHISIACSFHNIKRRPCPNRLRKTAMWTVRRATGWWRIMPPLPRLGTSGRAKWIEINLVSGVTPKCEFSTKLPLFLSMPL